MVNRLRRTVTDILRGLKPDLVLASVGPSSSSEPSHGGLFLLSSLFIDTLSLWGHQVLGLCRPDYDLQLWIFCVLMSPLMLHHHSSLEPLHPCCNHDDFLFPEDFPQRSLIHYRLLHSPVATAWFFADINNLASTLFNELWLCYTVSIQHSHLLLK